jgi:hypothetical protein
MFISRVFVSLSFVALILILPLNAVIISSIVWGLLLLAAISYTVAKKRADNPYLAILIHVLIVVVVILLSSFAGNLLIGQVR